MNFSNTLLWVLEESIKDFNIFLNTKNSVNHLHITDIKNAFYQRFIKNLKKTEYWYEYKFDFGINNLKLDIIENNTSGITFIETNKYAEKHKNFIIQLNNEVKFINFEHLKDISKVYNGLEIINNSINQINNFKIK